MPSRLALLFRNKLIIAAIGAVLVVIAFLVYWFAFRAEPEVADLRGSIEAPYSHPLTGQGLSEAANFFPLAVMIDNADEALFTFGLDMASIVFEAPVEGGRTRFMAIYDSQQGIDRVGPVRSVRPYFIDWAEGYKGAAILHVGGSPQGLNQLESASLINIDQIGADEIFFYRDEQLDAPSNVFTSSSLWLKAAERKKIESMDQNSWNFDTLQRRDLEQQLTINFSPDNQAAWVYNSKMNNYLRFNNRERHLTPLGEQLSAANVIVIDVEVREIDGLGRLSLGTIGSGDAQVLTAGTYKPATWIKNNEDSSLIFLDKETQQELVLNRGATWIEAVDNLDKVDYFEVND